MGRILLGLVALLLIAIGMTMLAGVKAKSDLKAKYSPPGAMVNVGGYRLHIFCEGSGSPTVITETGLGDPSLPWALVRPQVVKTTRTCVYDRAGLGWSDLSPKPRTAENIVQELLTLLTRETYQALAAADTKFLEAVIAEQKAFEPNLAQVRAARITTLGSPRPMCLFRRINALRYGEQG